MCEKGEKQPVVDVFSGYHTVKKQLVVNPRLCLSDYREFNELKAV